MASYLNLARRYLPSVTTTTPSFATIESIAQSLPPLPLAIFESHLDDPQPDMDFLLSATPAQLVHKLPSNGYVKEWTAIQELCQTWQALPQSDPFRQGVMWLWLEFDTSTNRENSDSPAIYFVEGFGDYYREKVGMTEITAVLKRLLECEPAPAMRQQFRRIYKALPASGRLFSLGNMSGRASTAVRVSLAGISPLDLVRYLDEIAWPGDLFEIGSLIDAFSPLFDHLALDLDVGEQIGPQVGLELYIKSRHSKAAWQPLFDQLVTCGLCLPDKREQLMVWTGFSNAYTDADIWPADLYLPETEGHYVFIRRINHVKLTVHPHKPLKAKAYVALQRLLTSRRPLKIDRAYAPA